MSSQKEFVLEIERATSIKHKENGEPDHSVVSFGRSLVEFILKYSLFMLFNGPKLTSFKLLLASIFGLFEAAHSQVGVS